MNIFSVALAVSLGLKLLRISRRRSKEKEKVGGELPGGVPGITILLILKAEEEAVARMSRAREEVERKARRGEIDPMHEHAIQNIGQLSGLSRHEIMDFIIEKPNMLEELDFLFKDESARKLLFFYQAEEQLPRCSQTHRRHGRVGGSGGDDGGEGGGGGASVLSSSDGASCPLTGLAIYFLRLSSRKYLGEETFQREVIGGLVNSSSPSNLLWSLERTVSLIFIPMLSNR